MLLLLVHVVILVSSLPQVIQASTVSGVCDPPCAGNFTCCNGNCAALPGRNLSGIQTTQMCNGQCCDPCTPPGNLPDWDGGSQQQLTCAVVSEARRQGLTRWSQWAYIMATIEHETANTFRPIRECYDLPGARPSRVAVCDKDLAARGYAPYYGRGYVQITHNSKARGWNYRKFERLMGCPLQSVPDLTMLPDVALYITVVGMKNGTFTGKKLENYISENHVDEKVRLANYKQARRVINGLDKAGKIAQSAVKWEGRVRACLPEGGPWICDFQVRYSYGAFGCRTTHHVCPWGGAKALPGLPPWTCKQEPCPVETVGTCCSQCTPLDPTEVCGRLFNCSAVEVTNRLEPLGCKKSSGCGGTNCPAVGPYQAGSFQCPVGCTEVCVSAGLFLMCNCS